MKPILIALLFFRSIISFSQKDNTHVVYFINRSVPSIDISLCDSSYGTQGKSGRLTYFSNTKNSSFARIFPRKHTIISIKESVINFKVKQVNFKEGLKENESKYYSLNYLQNKKKKGNKRQKHSVQNIGEEVAYNNILLEDDTSYFLIQHNKIFTNYYTKKNSSKSFSSPLAYRYYNTQYLASSLIFNLMANLIFSSGTNTGVQIDRSKTYIEKIDKKTANILMQE